MQANQRAYVSIDFDDEKNLKYQLFVPWGVSFDEALSSLDSFKEALLKMKAAQEQLNKEKEGSSDSEETPAQ